jgi:putative DNA primase/helicase
MEMLAGDGTEFRAVLLSMGLRIAPGLKARQLLAQYVLTTDPGRRAICVERLGWHNGVYVLPDGAVGPAGGERVLFQTGSEPPRLEKAGTLAGWRDRVAAPCVGNSRLVLAISAAFAAPLLEITKGESGGMHLVGHSSTGKTTALRVAASVWGGPEYVNRWRATANGLEAVAQSRNDALLVLDELAQVNPREAGEVAYMLANGSGKHRAQRNGLARRAASWRLLFLSAGEIGLAEHMREGGKTMRAGQEIRLVDLPADAEAGRGIFDTLNGRVSAAVLADELIAAVGEEYGTAAREFLSKLALLPREEVLARVRQLREDFLKENVPAGADGQASRVAARFALVAAGGLMATDMDITGWGPEEGIQAAAACYQAWLDRRGGAGATEEMEALKTVRLFLNLHGESRFTDLDRDDPHSTVNRAGFRRKGKRGIEYLFLTEVFNKEVCKGLDHRSVLRTLRDQGWLKPDDPDRYTAKRNGLEGPDSDGRYYLVRPDLGGDDED